MMPYPISPLSKITIKLVLKRALQKCLLKSKEIWTIRRNWGQEILLPPNVHCTSTHNIHIYTHDESLYMCTVHIENHMGKK